MEFILGCFFLLLIFTILIFISKKNEKISNILIVAFLLRSICVILDQHTLIKLPDGYSDAAKFETLAREFSRNDGLSVIYGLLINDSFFISRFISIFYSLIGESKMMAQSISVAFGTASVYLVYRLCLIIWDHESAKKAAWVITFFPSLVLYSSLMLREVYIVFFLLLGLIGIAKFIKKNSIISLFQIMASFYFLSLFHGPVAIGGIVFFMYLLFFETKKQIKNIKRFKINFSSFIFVFVSLIPIVLFLTNNFEIPYIGGLQTLINIKSSLPKINNYMFDTAAYPSWLLINNNYELLTKGLVKIFYFLYSPFPWDIKSTYHLIGLFDGILYIILTIYIFKNWHNLYSNPVTRVLILIFICYLIVYGISVGNFGTGIRHRSKFVVMLIILAAPKIHKFIFSNKKKIYNK